MLATEYINATSGKRSAIAVVIAVVSITFDAITDLLIGIRKCDMELIAELTDSDTAT